MDNSSPPPRFPVLHLIVYGSFMTQTPLFGDIKAHCDRVLGCQHLADEDIPQDHVHYCIVNPSVKDTRWGEILNARGYKGRKMFQKLWKIPEGKFKGHDYDEDKLCIYTIKGDVGAVQFNNGYSDEQLMEYAAQWHGRIAIQTDPPGQTVMSVPPKTDKVMDMWLSLKDDFTELFMTNNRRIWEYTKVKKWVNIWCYKNSTSGLFIVEHTIRRYIKSLYFYQWEINENLEAAANILEDEKCL